MSGSTVPSTKQSTLHDTLGSLKGGEGSPPAWLVKRGQWMMASRSSAMVILLSGSHSKMRLRMESSSSDRGKMVRRKFESLR